MNPNSEDCAICGDLALEDCLDCDIPLCDACADTHYEEEHDD